MVFYSYIIIAENSSSMNEEHSNVEEVQITHDDEGVQDTTKSSCVMKDTNPGTLCNPWSLKFNMYLH